MSTEKLLTDAVSRYRQYRTSYKNPYWDGPGSKNPLLQNDLHLIADAYIRHEDWTREWAESWKKTSDLPEATL